VGRSDRNIESGGGRRVQAPYTAAMPKLKVYAFSQHIGNLCVTHDTNVHKAKLGTDPAELLRKMGSRPTHARYTAAICASW
jgi:hypothetical protein